MVSRIHVVSGLPRSGTSLMMRMLEAAGIEPLTDHTREADEDNPRGYYELEIVKRLGEEQDWVPKARGKAVKVISQLLPHLPAEERYRLIFMRRNLDEVLRSQVAMLKRRGEEVKDEAEIRRGFILHLGEVEEQIRGRPEIEVLFVSYNRLLSDSVPQVRRIAEFIEQDGAVEAMSNVIEPGLYRQRISR